MDKLAYAVTLGAALAFGPAAAAGLDGSAQLVCATVDAMDCEAGAVCVRGRASEIGAPTFLRIDLDQKTIVGTQRTTRILYTEKSEDGGQMLLQGTEVGFGWTLAIDINDGTMAGTLVNRDGAFLLFGACTAL